MKIWKNVCWVPSILNLKRQFEIIEVPGIHITIIIKTFETKFPSPRYGLSQEMWVFTNVERNLEKEKKTAMN